MSAGCKHGAEHASLCPRCGPAADPAPVPGSGLTWREQVLPDGSGVRITVDLAAPGGDQAAFYRLDAESRRMRWLFGKMAAAPAVPRPENSDPQPVDWHPV